MRLAREIRGLLEGQMTMTDRPHEPSALDLIAESAANAQSRRRRARLTNVGIGIAGLFALLLIWKLAVRALKVPPYILPAPRACASRCGAASPFRRRAARLLPAAVEHDVEFDARLR